MYFKANYQSHIACKSLVSALGFHMNSTLFKGFICSLSFPSSTQAEHFSVIPAASREQLLKMLQMRCCHKATSHDKKVDAMHELFEQAGVIDLHFATLCYTGNISKVGVALESHT